MVTPFRHPPGGGAPGSPLPLLERVRSALRARHASPRTEQAYLAVIERFLAHHRPRHPNELAAPDLERYLSDLPASPRESVSAHDQTLSALLFLYHDVLGRRPPWLTGVVRAHRARRLPGVLTRAEVRAVLAELTGVPRLMGWLLYGAGLRVCECAMLRAADVELAAGRIVVRDGRGDKDRVALLPLSVRPDLGQHLERMRAQHQQDLDAGAGWVELPAALAAAHPTAGREWAWQWVFPAARLHVDDVTGQWRRHHLHESALQRAVKAAVHRAGVSRRVSCHTLRHSFATHLLEDGHDIRTVQELLGHRDVATTMIYSRVANRGSLGVRSPSDALGGEPDGR
jgi:integron integrase